MSLALLSVVFVVPASADKLGHVSGTVVGSAAPAVPDNSCPTLFDPTGGSRQVFSGPVIHQGRAETLSVSVCVVCCFPGGRTLNGSFILRSPGGTITGDANGNLCTCQSDTRFFITLSVVNGTKGLKKVNGDFSFSGSFVGGFSTIDGAFTSNTTLQAN